MKRKNENNSLEKFFNTPNKIITSKEALKESM